MTEKRGITVEQAKRIRAEKGLKDETKLQKIRVSKGLSQAQLAKLSGVATRTIQHYERGVRDIDGAKLNTLCGLCLALGCKIEDILENAETIEKLRATK